MTNKFDNFFEFEVHCNKYANYIYVREQIGSNRKSVALSELDDTTKNKWIKRWWEENRMPVRLKTDEELKAEGLDTFDD